MFILRISALTKIRLSLRFQTVIICLLTLPCLSSCYQFNLKQMTYELLRQEDCRRNSLDTFCSRTYANEYQEYERLRQEFIHSSYSRHQPRFSSR